ncbi:unnamed protein product [Phaedon cochleariae]|uniref:GH18 domain-containing protein n=1 Tax=Phaedon cochleariae TaxID=80249 RepID=A0A9P0GVF2_PHACE|nr:unnamed protein product [Phaedon cochleariae]
MPCDNIVCYYVPAYGNIGPEDLDPSLCTHLNYAFVRLDEKGNLYFGNEYLDITKGYYERTVALKERNPKLKVLLSVGDTDAAVFSKVAASHVTRRVLVNSTVDWLTRYSFDGLDVHWEKPAPDDAENFVNLLRDLREAFDSRGWLLSAAVYPNPSPGYDVVKISKFLHMINLMCYDFYGPWSSTTGQNSPLFASTLDTPYQRDNLNIAAALSQWLNAGAPKDKVNVGVPFYGRLFTLASPYAGVPFYRRLFTFISPIQHFLHAPIDQTKTSSLSYLEICKKYKNWTTAWDNEQKNHYKYTSTQWLGYDDEESIRYKARYVASQGVAGMMIWQISQDDVEGKCTRKQNLLKVINEELRERYVDPSTVYRSNIWARHPEITSQIIAFIIFLVLFMLLLNWDD